MTAKERVLKAASELFYAEGIRAVGVDRIAQQARVSKMTLYRHYPTKDDLVVAVLEARDAPALKMLHNATARARNPRDALLAPFTTLAPWFTSPAFRGCPFMNASLELADPGHPATQIAERHKTATRDHFAALAKEANAPAPEQLADQLAVLLDGAIAQAQMRDPTTVAKAALLAATAVTDAGLSRSDAAPAAG